MNNYLKSILVIVCYIVFVQLLPPTVAFMIKDNNISLSIFVFTVLQLLGGCIIILFYKKTIIKQTREFKSSYIKYIFKAQLLIYFSSIVASIFLILLNVSEQTSQNQDAIELMFGKVPIYAMVVMVCIVAPITEELVFRQAIITPNINKRYLYPISIVLACLIFASLHGMYELFNSSLLTFIAVTLPYIAISSVLTYCFIKTKHNIVINILIHGLNNTLATILILLVV